MGASSPIRAESWPEVSLVDITTKIGSGSTPRGGSETYLKERAEYALVRSQNVFDRHFESDGLAFISTEQAAGLKGVTLQPGDILLNITGDGVTFGRACVIPESVRPACVNQHVAIVRVDPRKAHFGYVLSFLTHPEVKGYIESFNAGGSRRAITKAHIESFKLPLPPLPEQRAIAHILGTLDDKIELNRRTNETLEAMARALFKSWFVDFDPVHAKKAGRKPEGMDAETAALFPDDFEDSEMGKIPRGWRVTRVDALAEAGVLSVGDGYRAKNSELSPFGSLPFARAGNVNNGFSFDDADHVSPEAVGRLGDKVSRPFDVVFTSKGTVGRFGFVGPHTSTFAYSPQLCFWRSTNQGELDSFYLYEWMQSRYFGEQVDRVKGQTDMAEYVSLRDQRRMVLMIPRTPVQASFAVVASAFHRQVWATVEETRTLAALRDALLPQLLSGSLRVPEAMRLVEKAL
jgi:type I restriction enzyme S subunit